MNKVIYLKIKQQRAIPVLVFLFLLMSSVYAQQNDAIVLSTSKHKLVVSNGELEDFTLRIRNGAAVSLQGTLNIQADPDIQLLSRSTISLALAGGDSLYLPVKFVVKKQARAGKHYKISFVLRDKGQTVQAETATEIEIQPRKNVALFALVSEILLDTNTDSLNIPVKIINSGNTPQKVNVISRMPSFIQRSDFHSNRELLIYPSADTVLWFRYPVNSRMYNQDGFEISVSGVYANGEVFGLNSVKVQSARLSRRYREPFSSDSYQQNSISLSSQNMFSDNESYVLEGNGDLKLGQGNVQYNIDARSSSAAYEPLIVRNTWLNYQTRTFGIRAGNIGRNLDMSLNGRGVSVAVNDTSSHNTYEAGYLDGNINLFGSTYTGLSQAGKAGWGTFSHQHNKWQLSSSAIYEINPWYNARNSLLSNTLSWRNEKNLYFSVILNGGRTAAYRDTQDDKLSMAAGFNLTGTLKGISINSINYLSTSYYPGLRRGGSNFSERFAWNAAGLNFWASLDYYRSEPRYFANTFSFNPLSGRLRNEIGMSARIYKSLTFSVAPNFTQEKDNSYVLPGLENRSYSLKAWNLYGLLNYPVSSGQNVSLSAEGGFVSSQFAGLNRFHIKVNSNYHYNLFNLNVSLQSGVFYLGEAVSTHMLGTGSRKSLIISPYMRKAFLHNKLRAEGGLNFNYNSYSGSIWQLNARTEYTVLPTLDMYTALNFNRYQYSYGLYQSNMLEAGITKKIARAEIAAKSATLEVFLYKDLNRNGMYDEGDSVATEQLLYINKTVFITKKDGLVNYRNLPHGEYLVTVPNIKGWYTPEQYVSLTKKSRYEIALQKTGVLNGRISFTSDEFSYEAKQEKGGIQVIATDDNGKKHTTRTDPEGKFVFYISAGRYRISINEETLPAETEYTESAGYIEVLPEVAGHVSLKLSVKKRKIETKKFVSPSVQKR